MIHCFSPSDRSSTETTEFWISERHFGHEEVKIKDFMTINQLAEKRICWLFGLSSFADQEQLKNIIKGRKMSTYLKILLWSLLCCANNLQSCNR